jgi:hypothetical protein
MTSRSRLRRWLKWCGLAPSLLIALAWALSIPFYFAHLSIYGTMPNGTPLAHNLYFHSGCISYMEILPLPGERPSWLVRYGLHPPYWRPCYRAQSGGNGLITILPLWMPFLIFAIPTTALTAFLWWFDRRRIPPGHCQRCRYDLTGNVSGACPECGERI